MRIGRRVGVTLTLAVGLAAGGAAAGQFTARDGGPGHGEMIARGGPSPAEGLSFVRPVLSGVLYRGGFQSGDRERD